MKRACIKVLRGTLLVLCAIFSILLQPIGCGKPKAPEDLVIKRENKLNPANWFNGVDRNHGAIQGQVTSKSLGQPEGNRPVTIRDTSGNIVATTRTNPSGGFSVRGIPVGAYNVEVNGIQGSQTYATPVQRNSFTRGTFNTPKLKYLMGDLEEEYYPPGISNP